MKEGRGRGAGGRYSAYLFYWYKSTNTDAEGSAALKAAVEERVGGGTVSRLERRGDRTAGCWPSICWILSFSFRVKLFYWTFPLFANLCFREKFVL